LKVRHDRDRAEGELAEDDVTGSGDCSVFHKVNILVVSSNYPHAGHPYSGAFNEKLAGVMTRLGAGVVVLSPKPYVPPLLSNLVPRWKAYGRAAKFDLRNGIHIYRPTYPQIPHFGSGLSADWLAFLWCWSMAKKLHSRLIFDAVLALDMMGPGVMGWRIAKMLGIRSGSWIYCSIPLTSSYNRAIAGAIRGSNVVFYQNGELLNEAASLLGLKHSEMSADRHLVLSHGIPVPPELSWRETRERVRGSLEIAEDHILVLSTGRVTRQKGVFDLLGAMSIAAARHPKLACVWVGSMPSFDDTAGVEKVLEANHNLNKRFRILPACRPEHIWEYLCAADIFAFTSHSEGMPNSLLEAMAAGLPSVAYAIPAVSEIQSGTESLMLVSLFDTSALAECISTLAISSEKREKLGKAARARVMDRFMATKNMTVALTELLGAKEKGA
jgi:teichuronic acid biosynthesis glycosyltransferase TuaC